MIAYYPLEEMEPPKQRVVDPPPAITTLSVQVGLEESELNYVVIAFILGVVALAISDAIRA
mgnify:FL=1|tara:strand:- start:2357 stop:2539 length:183 start_codon:yes stop_codon:yes gene_type:complete